MRDKFRAIYCGLLIIFIFAVLPLPNAKAGEVDIRGNNNEDRQLYSNWDLRAGFSGKDYREYGLDWSFQYKTGNSHWWFTQKFWGISTAGKSSSMNFSMQGAVSMTAAVIAKLFGKTKSDSMNPLNDPIFIILTLPSSRLEYALSRGVLIGVNNNTEYIFFRGGKGARGIYYTPSLTLSLYSFPVSQTTREFGLQLLVGYTSFWNFEGPNQSMGWNFGAIVSRELILW